MLDNFRGHFVPHSFLQFPACNFPVMDLAVIDYVEKNKLLQTLNFSCQVKMELSSQKTYILFNITCVQSFGMRVLSNKWKVVS